MSRMLMISVMFGLAAAASACTQSSPSVSVAENRPVAMSDVLEASRLSAPEWFAIDFQDSRTYGNNSGM